MIADIRTRQAPLWLVRVARVALFVVLITLSARIRVELPNTPVPITMQTLMIFISGMALGPVEGAFSVAGYVGAIAAGLPLDARGLGPAVFLSPTAGYLIGFIPAAFVAGLAWNKPKRFWLVLSLFWGIMAAAIILIFGTLGVVLSAQIPWNDAVLLGLFPFILIEPGKALLAAALVNLGRESWLRWIAPKSITP